MLPYYDRAYVISGGVRYAGQITLEVELSQCEDGVYSLVMPTYDPLRIEHSTDNGEVFQ